MMESGTTASRDAARPPAAVAEFGPPGVRFYVATLAAVLLALDATTSRSLDTFIIAAPIWLVIGIVWLLRFVPAASRARLRLPRPDWARWLVIPVLMGSVFAGSLTDLLYDARLTLSREALDTMAADVLAGGSTNRGWVGLYDVGTVDLTENGLRFVVDDSTLSRWGFAFAAAGEPVFIDDTDEEAGLWTGAWFASVGDGWWRWWQAWD